MFLKIGLAGISALLILAIFFQRRMKKQKFTPPGVVDSPKGVQRLLHNAIKTQSTFDLYTAPPYDPARRLAARCSPLALRRDGLLLETLWENPQPQDWTGKTVRCYFKINATFRPLDASPRIDMPEDESIYYAFDAGIKYMETQKSGYCHVLLRLPAKVKNRQKRSFSRFTPPEEYLMGAAMWTGKHMPPGRHLAVPRRWPKPELLLLPGKTERFSLDDLSAGGCKLRIHKSGQAHAGCPYTGDEALLLLSLLDPDARTKQRFWLHCRVRSASERSEGMEIGLQFLSWGKRREGGNAGADKGKNPEPSLEWTKLKHGIDVPGLGTWIARRQIELAGKEDSLG